MTLSKLPQPRLFEGLGPELVPESVLADLPLHDFQVAAHHTGREVARVLEQHPSLPGVVLQERGRLLGMISRQRLLEFLIRPQGMELFLPNPLAVLYSYARTSSLVLRASTPILAAAQLALRRPSEQQSEPVLVQVDPENYYLLAVHDLQIAYWQLRGIETQVRYERSQLQMVQTEKMASLGRLVDGVAHEILDPVGFIWGNLAHLSDYAQQIMQVLAAYERHFPEPPAEVAALREAVELDYLRQDLPQTITSIRAGAERLKNLVTSLQNFCHIDDVYPKPADLHDCLDSLLLLLKSRLKGEIQIVRNYGPLPPVPCYVSQLNQVFMNILTNAIDALLNQSVRQNLVAELPTSTQQAEFSRPQITLTTQVRSAPPEAEQGPLRWVRICIADNGPGISAEKYQQILDSFSIEKRIEKETSLALSYQIVTARHGGKFYLRSQPLVNSSENPSDRTRPCGTEFEIWLPLA
ncbi:MAG: ATP-binding protein [Elainella sp.]